ncbi:LuxR family transcriptional regulator [Listeria monocytogenes]|nr:MULTISPECIES: LuxR C-terminal-related transcriptional regulator [Priestia]EGI2115068.1 LuxR family transcriptional regulator [Listeria monocytogenes]MCE4093345.1 LuxR C-terminal-related transcriptional regulator [Priestia megaterium]MED3821429.1 LuxR C-terminal-related transcriptional regulator [Priestia aryabhattai]QSF36516.1 LuxR family transcriptional regulator [Priestia megaterium]QSF42417.1 LuxR family transcriptional regulator [Priestia megaterium]
MEKAEKLLMGIENVLGMASELFDEVARLKQVEEECKTLKEKLFMSQFTRSEKEVFELALDGLSSSKMAEWLFKERSTISQQRKDICKKLGVKNIKEAVQQFQNLHQEPQQEIHQESPQKIVNIS